MRDPADALRTLASTEPAFRKPLPGADLVWQRAAARVRWLQYERATRSIRVAELAASAACAAVGLIASVAIAPAFAHVHPVVVQFALAALAVTVASGWAISKVLLSEK